jgi:hypothetical protein
VLPPTLTRFHSSTRIGLAAHFCQPELAAAQEFPIPDLKSLHSNILKWFNRNSPKGIWIAGVELKYEKILNTYL